ncbi:MAG: rRNA cytosine-C5-methyltransferase [Bacteroidales bacterium]|nr:rRNA cytosine-C5-methyltransferase [Bacteroidales bacterium]
MDFRAEFIELLSEAIGSERVPKALEGLSESASVSVRLNPLKCEGVHLPILEGAVPVPWSPYGYMLRERPVFTLHPLFHSGVYYVQDSSAMFVGEAFRRMLHKVGRPEGRPLRVLDLCAAPGGKTTDLAASLREVCGEGFILVANEVMKARAAVLADNVARWGDPNVVVSNADPSRFARLEGFFDVIVADVPCSGEGMFRKDGEALDEWSPGTVDLCAQRQRRIIGDVWPALAPGGVLIYSTCTFNRFENDGNVRWIADSLGAEVYDPGLDYEGVIKTGCGYSLVPGFVPGEGQYCAALVKEGGVPAAPLKPFKPERSPLAGNLFSIPVALKAKGAMTVATPLSIAAEVQAVAACTGLISSGFAVGEIKGKDLVPDEDLALSAGLLRGSFPEAGVDKPTALAYLHKDAVVLGADMARGIVLLTYKGVPLGFVKNLGNRTNNLHPMSRRIRMDIK